MGGGSAAVRLGWTEIVWSETGLVGNGADETVAEVDGAGSDGSGSPEAGPGGKGGGFVAVLFG